MEKTHKGPKANESKENEKTQENVIAFNNSKITNGESIKTNRKLIDEKAQNLNQIKIEQEKKIGEHKKRTYIDKLLGLKDYNAISNNKYVKFSLNNKFIKRTHSNSLLKYRMIYASFKLYIISIINIAFLLNVHAQQNNFLKFSEVTLKVKVKNQNF